MTVGSNGRDWLDYVSALSGATGALLAAGAIWYSRVQGVRAQRALVRERRLDYELGLLAEMSEQFDLTGTQHLRGHLRAFVRSDQPDDDFPVARAFFDIRPTRQGRDRCAAISQVAADKREAIEREIQREIDEAIERRVAN